MGVLMGNTWMTDMTHFLDEDGRVGPLPGPGMALANYFGAIVGMVSESRSLQERPAQVLCRRRPGRRPCRGRIEAHLDPVDRSIIWRCPACGDNGLIHGWEASPWDRRTPQGAKTLRRRAVGAIDRGSARAKPAVAIYQLKVTLQGTDPPVWRRVLVRNDITLEKFHHILQVVMGWTDSHMHQFTAGRTLYGTASLVEITEAKDERKTRLFEVLRKPKDRLIYGYDFGDSWEHLVVCEEVVPPSPDGKYPWVVAGKRACPPEDIGGVWGYADFLAAIANPKHPDHEELLEWFEGPIDPEAFDAQAINRLFHGGWGPRVSAKPAPC